MPVSAGGGREHRECGEPSAGRDHAEGQVVLDGLAEIGANAANFFDQLAAKHGGPADKGEAEEIFRRPVRLEERPHVVVILQYRVFIAVNNVARWIGHDRISNCVERMIRQFVAGVEETEILPLGRGERGEAQQFPMRIDLGIQRNRRLRWPGLNDGNRGRVRPGFRPRQHLITFMIWIACSSRQR